MADEKTVYVPTGLVKTTLPEMVRHVGSQSQVTFLGDDNHYDDVLQSELFSPETVKAAKAAGKQYVIVEGMGDSRAVDLLNRYIRGSVSMEELSRRINFRAQDSGNSDVSRVSERVDMRPFLLALKENGIELLPVDRPSWKEMDAVRNHPEFERARVLFTRFRDAEAYAALEKAGQSFEAYKAWLNGPSIKEWSDKDSFALMRGLAKAKGAGVLVIWGEGHFDQPTDVDQTLRQYGYDARHIAVVGGVLSPQFRGRLAAADRRDSPDYVYYVREGLGGKLDSTYDFTRAPENRITRSGSSATALAVSAFKENSMYGFAELSCNVPGVELDVSLKMGDLGQLTPLPLPPYTAPPRGVVDRAADLASDAADAVGSVAKNAVEVAKGRLRWVRDLTR